MHMIKFHLPTKIVFLVLGILIIIAAVVIIVQYPKLKKQSTNNPPIVKTVGNDQIVVTSPDLQQAVSSPIQIKGKAKGNWFFEATFPVKILDENGNTLGTAHANAEDNWQTEDFVNFSVSLIFNIPKGTKGVIVFENDNPSGLPQNQKSFTVPVSFSAAVSSGKCAPNLTACDKDPKLCLDSVANVACN
jgi:hypothetical protein